MRKLLLMSMILASVTLARPALAVDQCAELSMTVTSQISTDPGFEGLYKYTVTGSWDVTQFGLSHIDFFLQLKDMECICDPGLIVFGGGTSTGTSDDGPCVVNYEGIYQCMGDDSVPEELAAATVKFNALNDECEPATTGTGTWFFYSPLAPGPYSVDPEGAAIKHGSQVCVGELAGTMPQADCSTPATPKSWGSLKAQYR
jgi:hypothetical protein